MITQSCPKTFPMDKKNRKRYICKFLFPYWPILLFGKPQKGNKNMRNHRFLFISVIGFLCKARYDISCGHFESYHAPWDGNPLHDTILMAISKEKSEFGFQMELCSRRPLYIAVQGFPFTPKRLFIYLTGFQSTLKSKEWRNLFPVLLYFVL